MPHLFSFSCLKNWSSACYDNKVKINHNNNAGHQIGCQEQLNSNFIDIFLFHYQLNKKTKKKAAVTK